ncbi:MDIS1-interacting receptor like kinase 2 [Vitis vinifera]|uniref:non-specific serine/threonine protein kinase n=1 Tax=Vitis vinifera TaxID=29760 RepID=A0A438CF97_VITVI|nr:MDIS1-interacting receptor like kinase 2 [Vitis vinifera]
MCLGGALENFTAMGNNFTGPIPMSLRNCTSLFRVRLNRNQLKGNITEGFGVYPNLNFMDLSSNNLYGELSQKWGQCRSLTSLNISHNNLSVGGPLPDIKAFQEAPFEAFINNHGLCGNVSGLKPCIPLTQKKNNRFMMIMIISSTSFLLCIFMGIYFTLHWRARNRKRKSSETPCEDLFAIWSHDGEILYQDIIEVTEDFNSKYCIGSGGQGTVYKAELPTGRVVAVKKLHPPQDELAYTTQVNNKTDVYSFGVVALEVLGVVALEVVIGRHPGDLILSLTSSSGSASSSSSVTAVADSLLLKDVIDQRFSPPTDQISEEVVFAVKLAFACQHVNPNVVQP